MRLFLSGLIAGAAMMVASSAAVAATTVDTTPDFAALALYSTSTGGGSFINGPLPDGDVDVYTSDIGGNILSPFSGQGVGAPGYYAAGPATGTNETQPNPLVLQFASLRSGFSFLWGSPDSYNTITFIDTINSTSVTLAALIGVGVGALYTQTGAVFVEVTGILFNQVSFGSSSQAVEFASISAVPIPAGIALLGAGVGLLGYLGYRRKRSMSAAA